LTVTVNEACFVESATEVAVTVTCCALLRLVVGDLYVMDRPVVELRDPGPLRLHVTPLADVSFVKVAEIATERP
jgi:hypothetical protein